MELNVQFSARLVEQPTPTFSIETESRSFYDKLTKYSCEVLERSCSFCFKSDSPELEELLKLIRRETGRSPTANPHNAAKFPETWFLVRVKRTFTRTEMESAQFFCVLPPLTYVLEVTCSQSGRIEAFITEECEDCSFGGATNESGFFFVLTQMIKFLEDYKLKGLIFKDIGNVPYKQMSSNILFPPLGNIFVDTNNNPIYPAMVSRNGYHLHDGSYSPTVLFAKLDELPVGDVFHTIERVGSATSAFPYLIMSKRAKLKFEMEFPRLIHFSPVFTNEKEYFDRCFIDWLDKSALASDMS